jgi:hypothetical protein
MLWLIWIVLMLLVPAVAGVQVWWQVRHTVVESAPAEADAWRSESLTDEQAV